MPGNPICCHSPVTKPALYSAPSHTRTCGASRPGLLAGLGMTTWKPRRALDIPWFVSPTGPHCQLQASVVQSKTKTRRTQEEASEEFIPEREKAPTGGRACSLAREARSWGRPGTNTGRAGRLPDSHLTLPEASGNDEMTTPPGRGRTPVCGEPPALPSLGEGAVPTLTPWLGHNLSPGLPGLDTECLESNAERAPSED